MLSFLKHQVLKPFFDSSFFVSSSIIFAGSFLVSVLNYVFTLLISRMIGVESFGEVAALMSLLLVVTVPASALTMLMTREVSQHSARGSEKVAQLFFAMKRRSYVFAFLAWIAVLCLSPLIALYLKISIVPVLLFTLIVPCSMLGALQSGALQGLQEFFALAKQSVLGTLIKLFGSLLLVTLGFSVTGVVIALVVAQAASWVYGHYITRAKFASVSTPESEALQVPPSMLSSLFGPLLFTSLLLVLLSNIDVLLAKHYLSASAAGHYGALSTVGKILIYGVGAFVTVLLPLVSAAHAKSAEAGKQILFLSLGVIFCCSIVAWAVFSVMPNIVVSILFGARYLDIVPYLAFFSIGMGSISLVTAFANYSIATYDRTFLWFLAAGMTVEVASISRYHADLSEVVSMLVYSSVFMLILMIVNFILNTRAKVTG